MATGEIVNACARRRSLETTLQETRVPLGFEGRRQWKDPAIARPTPLRLARFPLVTLIVRGQPAGQAGARQAAWHKKVRPTFRDALAQVRRVLWRQRTFCLSKENTDRQKSSTDLGEHLAYAT